MLLPHLNLAGATDNPTFNFVLNNIRLTSHLALAECWVKVVPLLSVDWEIWHRGLIEVSTAITNTHYYLAASS